MRILLTLLGIASIVFYSVVGLMLMNDWAVVAASGVPLERTIADMDAEDQPYSTVPGTVFAAMGLGLACAWGLWVWRRSAVPIWAAVFSWAGILALGAPAYFFASFGNLNSVGDTYPDWNAEAAGALVAPLYAASGVAFLIATIAAAVALTKAAMRPRQSPVS